MTLPAESTSTPRWRWIAALLFGLIALAAVIAVALRLSELEDFARLLTTARPAWLIVAFAAQALTYVFAALSWKLVLHRARVKIRLAGLVRLSVAKLFLDQVIPMGSISGILLLLHGLKRRLVPDPEAMATLFVTVISYYAAYLMTALASLGVLWVHHAASRLLWATTALFGLVAIGIPAILLWVRQTRFPRLRRLIERVPPIASLLSSAAGARADLLRLPGLYVATTAAQLAVFCLDIFTFWVIFLALGQPCPLWIAFAAFITASIAASLGPTPLGLGTYEGASVALLTVLGIPIETALAATLLMRGGDFWIPMLPGLILARRELM
jgi:uncharacterized membrane protein YbhN (UPF0104 family)